MGLTLAEKILARKAGREAVAPGEIVTVEPDVAMSHDNAAAISATFSQMGAETVWDPARLVIVLDHAVPAPTSEHAENHRRIRQFVREQEIAGFYDINHGVCHTVLCEQGHVRPGLVVVGSDSHTLTAGALGALAVGIGRTEMAAVWALGRIWLRVPATIRVWLRGRPGQWVAAKDVALRLLAELGPAGADYRAVEYAGGYVEGLSTEERMVLCNMAAEAGAKTAMVAADRETRRWLDSPVDFAASPSSGQRAPGKGKGDKDLIRILCKQQGLAFVELSDYRLGDSTVLGLLPAEAAWNYKCLPLQVKPDGTLVVAVSDPLNVTIADDLRLLTERDIEPVVADEAEILECVAMYYGEGGKGTDEYARVEGRAIERIVEDIEREQKRRTDKPWALVLPDTDARYERTIDLDVSRLEPQVATPHSPANGRPVGEVAGIEIDQVYIGSCAGGLIHDLRTAARILEGRRIAPTTRLIVVPASMETWQRAREEGVLTRLIEAGAVVCNPGCGACLGAHQGVLAAGERCLSTTNRNFQGRMGNRDAEIYLSGAAVAAATALTGRIADPREV